MNDQPDNNAANDAKSEAKIDKSGRRPTRPGAAASSSSSGGGMGLALVGMVLGIIALGAGAYSYIQVTQLSEEQAEQNRVLREEVASLESQLSSINKISEETLGALRTRMQKAVEQTEKQLAQIDGEGILINTRSINELGTVVRKLRGEVAGAVKDLPKLDKRIKSVQDSGAKNLGKLQKQMEKRTGTLDKSIKKSAKELDKRTKTLDTAVSDIKVQSGKLALRMEEVDKSFATVLKKLDKLSYEVDNFDDSAVDKLNTRMDTLVRDYGALQQSIRKVQQDMVRLNARARAGGN